MPSVRGGRLEDRRPGRRRLVWRELRPLRPLPARRPDPLPEHADPRGDLRWRLRRSRPRRRSRIGRHSGRAQRGRGGAADVCRCDDLQRASPQRAGPGDLVAVLGLGGLGHLGVQFAAGLGSGPSSSPGDGTRKHWPASSGPSRTSTARSMTRRRPSKTRWRERHPLDSDELGAMSAVVGGLAPRGRLMLLGASMDPVEVPPAVMIGNGGSVQGHASGTSKDSEDTLAFSAHVGVGRWSRRCRSSGRRSLREDDAGTPGSGWS